MQDSVRDEVLEQLQHAWRDAALGAADQAQHDIREVLDLLDSAIAQHSKSAAIAQTAHGYIEDARESVGQSDALGVILALVAALKELERQPKNQ